MSSSVRNQMLGIRTTENFVTKFDELCDRLGYNRSEVVRYCLKRFLNEHWNNSENFQRARKDLF
jgi:metal-responsive CopG/Arc/MetJ family transcriptional regulator